MDLKSLLLLLLGAASSNKLQDARRWFARGREAMEKCHPQRGAGDAREQCAPLLARRDVNEHPLEMYTPPPSRFSDAELEEMMRAQGVDPREVEEYRFDVPTEFDLTPSELRQYDPDDEMYNEEAVAERDFYFHVRGLGAEAPAPG